MEEAERRTEAAAVDEFHHRKQLLQFVLERRSAEHESITAFQLFYGASGGGGPVPDALRFIQDDEVGRHLVDVPHVFEDQFVTRKVEELGRSEERRVGKECRSRWSPY